MNNLQHLQHSQQIQQTIQWLQDNPYAVSKEQCRRSLAEFIKQAWHILEPAQAYVHGWHIDAMAEHLEAVTNGHINRLLINVPPGMMKSLATSVFWPAWEWGARDLKHMRYITAAHSKNLAARDSVKMRRLIKSEWYRDRWVIDLEADQDVKTKFENIHGGLREVCSSDNITGVRGDRVILDDPHTVKNARYDTQRETVVEQFRTGVINRLNDPDKSAIVVIMQRLHQGDVSGFILAKEIGYTHLCLPMEYEVGRQIYFNALGYVDPRKKAGELLFPERFSRSYVDTEKRTMGSMATAGQYQQRPAPSEGAIFKEEWFDTYATLKKYNRIVISIDSGYKEKEQSDPSAILVWGEHTLGSDLLEVECERMAYPTLKKRVKKIAERYKNEVNLYAGHRLLVILIEDKASGISLIQDLKVDTNYSIVAIQPHGDKVVRASTCSPLVEAGKVFLPLNAPWLEDYKLEMTTFPNSVNKDQVDATSQYLNWLSTGIGRFTEDYFN